MERKTIVFFYRDIGVTKNENSFFSSYHVSEKSIPRINEYSPDTEYESLLPFLSRNGNV